MIYLHVYRIFFPSVESLYTACRCASEIIESQLFITPSTFSELFIIEIVSYIHYYGV